MTQIVGRREFVRSFITSTMSPVLLPNRRQGSSRREVRLSGNSLIFNDRSYTAAYRNLLVVSAAFSDVVHNSDTRIVFSPTYGSKYLYLSDSLKCISLPNSSLDIDFAGLNILFTAKFPVAGKAYLDFKSQSGTSSSITLRNAIVGIDRPSIRTPDSDLIRINGFDFVEADLAISCADNMGLTVGRSAKNLAPRLVKVKLSCLGREFDQPHSHAPIGDTAVWLPNGAENIDFEISGRGTGDDFIFVGPLPRFHVVKGSPSRTIRIDISDCATGVKVASNSVNITGSVRNTVGPAIAVTPGLFASDWVPKVDGCRIHARVDRAGQLEAGDIGQRIIPLQKNSGSAVWVYGSVSNLDIDGSVFSDLRGGAILLQPSGTGIANVHGRVAIQNMPVDRYGKALPALGKTAVVRRNGAPTASVSSTDLTARVRGVHGPATLGFIDRIDHANQVTVLPAD